MAAPVPALERANRILNELARSPQRKFTAAELASTLDIHRATCFSILSCLSQLGLLQRDPVRKTYSLGPGLLRLGAATAEQYPGLAEARKEMHALSDQLDVGGLICTPANWEIVMLDQVASDTPVFEKLPWSETVTAALAPPLGAIFVAWSPIEAIEEWLSRAPAESSPADMESFRRSVSAIRARGYSIGSQTEVELQLEEVLARLEENDQREQLTVALELADLIRVGRGVSNPKRSTADQQIGHLIGPIFGSDGQVPLTITIFGHAGQILKSNIDDYVDPLLESCSRVSKVIGGIWPQRAGGS
jgi:DNA-binding IclR family transcriptional regulator